MREELENIRAWMLSGAITREEAKHKAAPIIDEINKKSVEIAKKYGQRPRLVTFASIMR